jgi:hypothetical protein
VNPNQTVNGCYNPNPWGNGDDPVKICAYYGLTYLNVKDPFTGLLTHTMTTAARLAVVHWGGADCSNGAQYYQFIQNSTVIPPQVITSPGSGGFSFAVYCGCNVSQENRYR